MGVITLKDGPARRPVTGASRPGQVAGACLTGPARSANFGAAAPRGCVVRGSSSVVRSLTPSGLPNRDLIGHADHLHLSAAQHDSIHRAVELPSQSGSSLSCRFVSDLTWCDMIGPPGGGSRSPNVHFQRRLLRVSVFRCASRADTHPFGHYGSYRVGWPQMDVGRSIGTPSHREARSHAMQFKEADPLVRLMAKWAEDSEKFHESTLPWRTSRKRCWRTWWRFSKI